MSGSNLQDAHLHIMAGSNLELSSHIKRVFLNSTGETDIPDVLNLSSETILPFLGVHPWQSNSNLMSKNELFKLISINHQAGIGECGLDFGHRYKNAKENQISLFRIQLEAAFEYRRPLSIHCVRAWGRMIELIREFSPLPAPFILHSFYGSSESADILMALGGYISISPLSIRNPEHSFPIISRIPQKRILIESDQIAGSADFSAEKHLQTLKNLYNTISEIYETPLDKIISRIWDNGAVFKN